MRKQLENPIFWRGINSLIQTLGLFFGVIVGAYITMNGLPIRTINGHNIEVSSPIMKIIYNGQAPGIAIILISLLGLILIARKGKAKLDVTTKDAHSNSYLELLGNNLDKNVTSRMMYDMMMEKLGVDYRKVVNDEDIRMNVIKYKNIFPELTEQELFDKFKQISKDFNPSETLLPLLNDIIANIPPKYKLELPDAFAGEIPLKEINASMSSPTGGLLILLNKGLTISFKEWSKLITTLVTIGNNNCQKADLSRDDIFSSFRTSIKDYLENDNTPFFPKLATDDKAIVSRLLAIAAIEFVIAHEFAHYILGHIKLKPPKNQKEALSREMDADKIACDIFLNGIPLDPEWDAKERLLDIQMRLAGMVFCFGILYLLEIGNLRTTFPKYNSSNPNISIRFAENIQFINNYISENQYPYPFLSFIRNAVDELIGSISSYKPSINSMDEKTKLLFEFYTKHKTSHLNKNDMVDADKVNDLLQFVPHLLDTSYTMSSNIYIDRSFDWSDGDILNSFDIFNLACKIIEALGKLRGKNNSGEGTMYEAGHDIANALDDAANDLEKHGYSYDADQKHQQSKSIRNIVNVHYSSSQKII